jgi:D-arabinose 1-dehydrogenase-like Zn-dependent alcohol dehydrogenase
VSLARADNVLPLPDALNFADAAPLMCAGLTVYAGLVYAGFEPTDKVAVVGLGGLGEMGIQFARAMGGRVAVVSSTKEKETRARELGAEKFIHEGTEKIDEALRSWDGGADIILQVAPSLRGQGTQGQRHRALHKRLEIQLLTGETEKKLYPA